MNAPIPCSSKISQVTVHARGALVRRQVTVPAALALPAGDIDLCIDDITPLAEPGSVRAAAPPGSRPIIAVSSALIVPAQPIPLLASQARVSELQGVLRRLDLQLQRLHAQRQSLLGLQPNPMLRPGSLLEKVDERMADALSSAQLIATVQGELDARLTGLEAEREAADKELDAARLLAAQATTDPRPESERHKRRITVRLGGGGALQQLEVLYVVPAARFWPTYTLRISDGGRKATWLIEALCAQLSGEDWRDVQLSLSTADLIFDARLPELASLRFGRAQPAPRRGYRPPPEGLERMFSGYDRAFGGAAAKGGASAPAPAPQDMLSDYAAFDADEEAEAADAFADGGPPVEYRKDAAPRATSMSFGRPSVGKSAGPGAADSPRLGGASASHAAAPPPPPQAPSGYGGPPAMKPMAPMMAAAPAMPSRGGAPRPGGMARNRMMESGGGGGSHGGLDDNAVTQAEPSGSGEPQDAWLDFDHLIMAGASEPARRGRLSYSGEADSPRRQHASAQIEALSPGERLRDPQSSRGRFDHRYDADGLVLIPSDGQPQRVALLLAETVPSLRMLTVPRERPEVYREAELQNPCEAPLLSGPVEVYVEGSLLTTATIEHIDRGGTLRVGMGVEDRLRVARNVRSEEETVGILGGSTVVTHTVTIELSSALGQACVVEVMERLPVSEDKSMTVEFVVARPEASPYTQADRGSPLRGGLQWRVSVAAACKAKLEYQYRITLPAKTEIVGGNRRD